MIWFLGAMQCLAVARPQISRVWLACEDRARV